ncbi:MarR family winged helix-turn-helix transcriptional regulator [Cellulomonas massiliensis]|uniref:MarR family winged helix-turn-helix transcriptional regulator n=1 Tax=Cellulomonas massiliensis TaxID=1465811 RepID=UPI0002D825B0|nr:MarR family transcriptional regulator [Cellulomonas massiliensis]
MSEIDDAVAKELGILLKATQAALHQRMDEALRPLGLTVSQYACLSTLHEEPGITASELARRTFVSRQSMNVLLQGLERQGLVERTQEPGPRRERAADLTPPARRLLARAESAVATVTSRMLAGLTPSQRDGLREALTASRDALLHPGADAPVARG